MKKSTIKLILLCCFILAIIGNLKTFSKGYFPLGNINDIEVLTNCENHSISSGKGLSTTLHCVNGSGNDVMISCCDFDSNYTRNCSGRSCESSTGASGKGSSGYIFCNGETIHCCDYDPRFSTSCGGRSCW